MSGMLAPEVLVLGGSGVVGRGIVAALLEAGSPVLAAARDPDRLQQLRDGFADEPGLSILRGSVADDTSAAALAADVALRPRPLSAVVASLGSPLQRGRMVDRPSDLLMQRLVDDVMPHLSAARHLLPLLGQGQRAGRYILIGSPCALRPWSGHGDASVAAAATRMLAQVLHEEAQALGVRVQMLELAHPVCTPENASNACSEWPSALGVGRSVVSLLDGGGDNRVIQRCDSLACTPPPRLLSGVVAQPDWLAAGA